MRLPSISIALIIGMSTLAGCSEEAPLTSTSDSNAPENSGQNSGSDTTTDSGSSDSEEVTPEPTSGIILVFGPEVTAHLQATLEGHIQSVTTREIVTISGS